jgi:hypothetical protein
MTPRSRVGSLIKLKCYCSAQLQFPGVDQHLREASYCISSYGSNSNFLSATTYYTITFENIGKTSSSTVSLFGKQDTCSQLIAWHPAIHGRVPPVKKILKWLHRGRRGPGKPAGGFGLALIFLVLFVSRQKGQQA